MPLWWPASKTKGKGRRKAQKASQDQPWQQANVDGPESGFEMEDVQTRATLATGLNLEFYFARVSSCISSTLRTDTTGREHCRSAPRRILLGRLPLGIGPHHAGISWPLSSLLLIW